MNEYYSGIVFGFIAGIIITAVLILVIEWAKN